MREPPDPGIDRQTAVARWLVRYRAAQSPAEQAALWQELQDDLVPSESGGSYQRLQAAVTGLDLVDLVPSDAYTRYTTLLVRTLAEDLASDSDDTQWFQAFLDTWDPAWDEYDSLLTALAEMRAARRMDAGGNSGGSDPFPRFDLSFLQPDPPAAPESEAIWGSVITPSVETEAAGGLVRVAVRWAARIRPGVATPLRAVAGSADPGNRISLLNQPILLDRTAGLAGRCHLQVWANRVDGSWCRLGALLNGPALRDRFGGIRFTLTRPTGPGLEQRTTADGRVLFPPIPIRDLLAFGLGVELPRLS